MTSGIAICVPTGRTPEGKPRQVFIEWAIGFVAQIYPPGSTVEYLVHRGSERGGDLVQARTTLAAQALKGNRRYIWYVDDDVILPGQAAIRLMHALEHDPTIGAIGGIYVSKTDPVWPLVYRQAGGGPSCDFKTGEIFEVEGIGTGCLMVRADVFAKLDKPWFQMSSDSSNEQWFSKKPGEETCGSEFVGEDMFFCAQVRKAGFKVLAHAGVLCGHMDKDGNIFHLEETK